MVTDAQVERFAALYKGLDRVRGVWKKTGYMETVKEAPTVANFRDHLDGDVGIGIVPIDDDSMVQWGAIDIDAHEDGEYIPLQPLVLKIEEFGYPLIVCQSKSQGAHLYLFLSERLPAALVQGVLKQWAANIGYPGVEVFPKQKKLSKGQVGNWINLPYFNAEETVRFAWSSGQQMSLDEFLDRAEASLCDKSRLMSLTFGADHQDAPPCIQHILTKGGVTSGSRNNALFNIAVYLKKIDPNNIEEPLMQINYDKSIVYKPLPRREITTIVSSVGKGDYGYRCNEEPICSLCDKELCKTRKYGIGQGNKTMFHDFIFGGLKKIMTDPPKYLVEVNGREMVLDHAVLFNFISFQLACFAYADLVIPDMKKVDWQATLKQKMDTMECIDAPEDVGPKAVVGGMLEEFTRVCERMDENTGQPKYGNIEDVLRGIPVLVENDEKQPTVVFRSTDFIAFLKRKRSEEAKGADLWVILRGLGCGYSKSRVGKKVIRLWQKPANLAHTEFKPITIEEKF